MANICFNDVYIYGDPQKIKTFYSFLQNMLKYSKTEGCIDFSDIKKELKLPEKLKTRYYMSNIKMISDEVISFDSETAWNPNDDLLDEICEHFDLDFAMYSDYDGTRAIYNDPQRIFFKDRYVIDFYENNKYAEVDQYNFANLDEFKEFIKKHDMPKSSVKAIVNPFDLPEELENICNFYIVSDEYSYRGDLRLEEGYVDYIQRHFDNEEESEIEM